MCERGHTRTDTLRSASARLAAHTDTSVAVSRTRARAARTAPRPTCLGHCICVSMYGLCFVRNSRLPRDAESLARSLASRTYTFLLDSRRSSILDEADASREIIASILFESCVFRNMPDTLLLLHEYRHSRRCLILDEQHRSIDPRYLSSDSCRYLIFLNFKFYYLTCVISISCLFISVEEVFFD